MELWTRSMINLTSCIAIYKKGYKYIIIPSIIYRVEGNGIDSTSETRTLGICGLEWRLLGSE
jgi:hypothetical protein